LLTRGPQSLQNFAQILTDAAERMEICNRCGNLDTANPCHICTDQKREPASLCVVAGIQDLWAIERTGFYRGRYLVLGGVLSALDGVGPDDLAFSLLEERLEDEAISEVILALGATVDGQATAHYVTDLIHRHHNRLKITRLAHGMPVGGELDYMDDGTIMTALKSRAAI
jgi:recombination protein RecR